MGRIRTHMFKLSLKCAPAGLRLYSPGPETTGCDVASSQTHRSCTLWPQSGLTPLYRFHGFISRAVSSSDTGAVTTRGAGCMLSSPCSPFRSHHASAVVVPALAAASSVTSLLCWPLAPRVSYSIFALTLELSDCSPATRCCCRASSPLMMRRRSGPDAGGRTASRWSTSGRLAAPGAVHLAGGSQTGTR